MGCVGYRNVAQQLMTKPQELWVTHDEKLWLSSMPRLVTLPLAKHHREKTNSFYC